MHTFAKMFSLAVAIILVFSAGDAVSQSVSTTQKPRTIPAKATDPVDAILDNTSWSCHANLPGGGVETVIEGHRHVNFASDLCINVSFFNFRGHRLIMGNQSLDCGPMSVQYGLDDIPDNAAVLNLQGGGIGEAYARWEIVDGGARAVDGSWEIPGTVWTFNVTKGSKTLVGSIQPVIMVTIPVYPNPRVYSPGGAAELTCSLVRHFSTTEADLCWYLKKQNLSCAPAGK